MKSYVPPKPFLLLPLLSLTLLLAPVVFAEDAPPRGGLPAEVHRVEIASLDHVLRGVGTLRANESVIIRSEISGRVESILFNEGEMVTQGQELFRLDSASYNAELAQAQAQANLSRQEYQRASDLLERRVGSQNERDTKLAQLRVNEAQVEFAKTSLDKTRIRAPFAGMIGLRHISPGDFITSGQDLVELTDFSEMKIDFAMPERNLGQLSIGQTIMIEVDAFPGEQFSGEIFAISPSSNARSHNINVRANIPNPDGRLRPGLFSKIEIVIGRDDQAIMIPEQAIMPLDNAFFVMKMDENNMLSMVPVTMGARRFGEVQITEGLAPGDVVVTAGQIKLQPGMPITPLFSPSETSSGSDV
ncbi:efflux transporter periplasmic adaptor subunit [Nitrincola tibetensis]|uniref:Efflux transporter periplasmic adaptor subunit n=1 Tax=Nitrincola tibetensis TaxID=2219697 RepID=A0A364NK93_9GAMM|nr:efflux RND transporter periplasmic adaptor subunit [Nitrincola tibetensis]RAU17549.1 efflux transporter periplasmic adaptor subunit [Nitrincola tibetensis]